MRCGHQGFSHSTLATSSQVVGFVILLSRPGGINIFAGVTKLQGWLARCLCDRPTARKLRRAPRAGKASRRRRIERLPSSSVEPACGARQACLRCRRVGSLLMTAQCGPGLGRGQGRHILVKEVNWLGKLILSLPVLRMLRAAFHSSILSVLIRQELAGFFNGMDWIDEAIPYTIRAGLRGCADQWKMSSEVRARRLDLAVFFLTALGQRYGSLWPACHWPRPRSRA
jgi:hypothetical protein